MFSLKLMPKFSTNLQPYFPANGGKFGFHVLIWWWGFQAGCILCKEHMVTSLTL